MFLLLATVASTSDEEQAGFQFSLESVARRAGWYGRAYITVYCL